VSIVRRASVLISETDGLEWIEQMANYLGKAQIDFDVFVTGDRILTFQHDLSRFDIAIVVLQAETFN
jgi:hypothetical protein